MSDVMHLINTSLIYASSWFMTVFDSSGMTPIYLSIMFIVITVRFLIQPFVGVATFRAASDRVDKVYKKVNMNSKNKSE